MTNPLTNQIEKPMENPSAFPLEYDQETPGGTKYRQQRKGMTLLDYFAAKIAQGIMQNPDTAITDSEDMQSVARDSYDIASIMLIHRKKLIKS